MVGIGIRVSIDDFGTGYSSLNYLKQFPVRKLKIDQSFVSDIGKREEDAAIARAIIHLGHSLGMKVVAEGVETEAQLKILKSLECDEIQGYLFSRPLSAEDFAQLLLDRASDAPDAAGQTTKPDPALIDN